MKAYNRLTHCRVNELERFEILSDFRRFTRTRSKNSKKSGVKSLWIKRLRSFFREECFFFLILQDNEIELRIYNRVFQKSFDDFRFTPQYFVKKKWKS